MPRQQVVPTPNAEPKSLSQGTTCNTSNGYIPVPHHFLSIMITPMATQTRPSMLLVMGPTGPMDIRSSGQIPTQFPLQQPLSTASSEVPTLSSPTPETAVEATPEVRKKGRTLLIVNQWWRKNTNGRNGPTSNGQKMTAPRRPGTTRTPRPRSGSTGTPRPGTTGATTTTTAHGRATACHRAALRGVHLTTDRSELAITECSG